jgi:uncharacterized protein
MNQEKFMSTRLILTTALLAFVSSAALAQPKPPAAKPAPEKTQASPPAATGDLIKDGLASLEAKNYEAALKAFNDAYNAGQGDGAFYLARMLELGVGIEGDPEKARLLYLAAADKGSAKALNRVGLMSFRGEGVLQDYKAARETICKGADLGEADAEFNCANLLAQGHGGPKDMGKAMTYYAKASDHGHIGAMNTLGFAYRDGANGAKDLEKARSYFEKAATKGNPVGLFEIASMYEAGNPVSKDLGKAHLYYNLAAARQHPQASAALQRLSEALSAEDIEKAQSEARSWKAAE